MASKQGVTIIVAGEDQTGAVFDAVNKHLQETGANAKETTGIMSSLGDSITNSLAGFAAGFGIAEIARGFKEMISSTMESAIQIEHLSEQTGMSAATLSKLKYAADESGVSFEVLSKGFKKLSTEVLEADSGSSKAVKTFTLLGISQADLKAKGNDMFGVMELVAGQLQKMPDGIEKNAIMTQLFGRSGQDLIPVLGDLSDLLEKAEKHATVFKDDDLKKMKDMHQSVEDLSHAWQTLEKSLASFSAPAITDFNKQLTEMLNLQNLTTGISGMARDSAGWAAKQLMLLRGDTSGAQAIDAETKAHWSNFASKNTGVSGQSKSSGSQLTVPDEAELEKQKEAAQKAAELARQIAELQARERDAELQLAKSAAQLDLAKVKGDADEAVQLLDSLRKQDLLNEGQYLIQKQAIQDQGFQAEQSALKKDQAVIQSQLNGAYDSKSKTQKEELEREIQIANLRKQEIDVESKLAELAERRAKAAQDTETAMESSHISMPDSASMPDLSVFGTQSPNVTMPFWNKGTQEELAGESEKVAHAIFDPLFNLNESWNNKWKDTTRNLKGDLGQLMESQLFGALFGDPYGRGGKGWDGSHGKSDNSMPGGANLLSEGAKGIGSLFSRLFGKKSASTSNGGYGGGAGTTPTPSASLLGMGAGAASGGIQVVINNTGTPQNVTSTQQSQGSGDPKSMVLNIVTEDLGTNGPIAQGILGMIALG